MCARVCVCVYSDAEDKPESKEKSRKSHRFHPYKERHGGGSSADKKAVHRNRVFISNIPYDMKWQAIKDLMREKGNPRRDSAPPRPLPLSALARMGLDLDKRAAQMRDRPVESVLV